MSLISIHLSRSNQLAIVGIVAILHLWVFAALAMIKPVPPEPTPMSVSFVSRPADSGTLGQSEPAVESRAKRNSQPADEPTTAVEAAASSSDQADLSALDQTQSLSAQTLSAQSTPDQRLNTSSAPAPIADVDVDGDDQLINLDVLAAVNSTLQKQSGAQQQVDRALDNLSATPSKQTPEPDRSVLMGSGDAALASEATSTQSSNQSSNESANKNSNAFAGINTACPAFFHQLPVGDQFELAANGCTLGQVQGCELKFDQVGIKNFPAFDAQAGITQGEVVISFTVTASGLPAEIELRAATTQSMARSALKFLTTSRFVPLKDSSRCGPYALPVRFSLYD